ncbi:DUF2283 domain-containing protein [Deferribacter thermophilus]|uniref:DUF2283 domain-containing protein n=1 Tax=Deferribacter thermophilus TaxID=53573 RepID=UPI003C172E9A
MKVYYDDAADAIYIELNNVEPDGVIESDNGINLDTDSEGRIVGIEILNASKKIDLSSLLTYSFEVKKKVV